jgi:hypothetical protein
VKDCIIGLYELKRCPFLFSHAWLSGTKGAVDLSTPESMQDYLFDRPNGSFLPISDQDVVPVRSVRPLLPSASEPHVHQQPLAPWCTLA